jgi:RNA polymerase sigma factor (sigma-70 family)
VTQRCKRFSRQDHGVLAAPGARGLLLLGPGESVIVTLFVNDPELLRGFRDGNPKSLMQLYWAYVDRIEKIFRAGVAGSPSAAFTGLGPASSEIEDLVQEVFKRAFAPAARRSYDGRRPYGPYLFTIARNVLADWWRRWGREIPTDWPTIEAAAERGSPDEDTSYADARTMAVVESFIRGLSDDLRAVHEQRFVVGLSQRDAAVALGIGRQTLRTLEARLMEGLRAALGSEDVTPAPVTAVFPASPQTPIDLGNALLKRKGGLR